MRMLSACSGVLGLAATSALAQYPVPPPPTTAGLSRQEVVNDLALWQRAGLGYWPSASAEPWMADTRDYRQAYATYLQLREQARNQDTMAVGAMPTASTGETARAP